MKVPAVDWNEQSKATKWRANWAAIVNEYLEANGHADRIDHRSYAEQGVEKIPTTIAQFCALKDNPAMFYNRALSRQTVPRPILLLHYITPQPEFMRSVCAGSGMDVLCVRQSVISTRKTVPPCFSRYR